MSFGIDPRLWRILYDAIHRARKNDGKAKGGSAPAPAPAPTPASNGGPCDDEESAYRKRVISTSFRRGGLTLLPPRWKKRRVVLEAYAGRFERGRTYDEREVNQVIHAWGGDHCVIRKALCAEGFMVRDKGIYERIREVDPELVKMVERIVEHGRYPAIRLRKAEKKPATLTPKGTGKWNRPAVVAVQNGRENRIRVLFAAGAHAALKRERELLEAGIHPCAALQADWNRLDPWDFEFRVLEELPKGIFPKPEHAADFERRARAWRDGFSRCGALYPEAGSGDSPAAPATAP